MFIDYVSLMLINMSAGFFMLAIFIYKGLDSPDRKIWAPGFLAAGAVALLCGLHMIWTWPLPGSYNSAFGEMSVFLGIIFLAAALALAKEYDLFPLGIYSAFAGLAAVLLGVRIINLRLTAEPLISGTGFILSGLSGLCVLPVLYFRAKRFLIVFCTVVLIATSLIWARTGYMAYWGHMSGFSKWVPSTMHQTDVNK